jgi:hypothetical protein
MSMKNPLFFGWKASNAIEEKYRNTGSSIHMLFQTGKLF